MIQIIWLVFEKEEVDLFALEDNFHCLTYFSKEQDALVHNWPNVHLPLHYIYAFSRRFYPKRLTVHSGYTFSVSLCVPWELNPQRFELLTQCSTTEPKEHLYVFPQISLFPQVIRRVREVRCSPLLWYHSGQFFFSQARGLIWYLLLSARVANTILEARTHLRNASMPLSGLCFQFGLQHRIRTHPCVTCHLC